MADRIQIVDKQDNPIGAASRQEVWEKGLYYRLVHVILRDERGNFLLQKRSASKVLYPNRWTNAASGHVDEGEEYETAAARELNEELGITADLEYVGNVFIHLEMDDKNINQFNGVFQAYIDHDTPFELQADEVSEVRWFTLEELKEKTTAAPEEFTPAMAEALNKFYLA